MEKIKILIIRSFPNYMDLKNTSYNIQEVGLASALVRKGHQCDIVFWTDKEPFDVEEPVYYNNKIIGFIHVFYRTGRTILKNCIFHDLDDLLDEYDIIQSAEYNQFQSWILAKNKNDKLVIYHGQYYGKINRRYNMMCFAFDLFGTRRYIDKQTVFITKSEFSREYLTDKGISKNNVHAIGVGLNPYIFERKTNESPIFVQELLKEHKKIRILYVGNFAIRRHLDFIGDIVKKLNDNSIPTELIIVGGIDTKYGQDIWSYYDKIEIKKYIRYEKKIEQKYMGEIYKNCDYLLFPSEYEIFGMVLLEAMYYGTVVLSSMNGGSATLINNNVNGIILEKRDVDIWIEKILELENDKLHKNKIIIEAKKTIQDKFTWDALVDDFINVYQDKMKR